MTTEAERASRVSPTPAPSLDELAADPGTADRLSLEAAKALLARCTVAHGGSGRPAPRGAREQCYRPSRGQRGWHRRGAALDDPRGR
jgi:hypothetical protein